MAAYYVAVGGSVTNPANIASATGASYPTNYMTVACHNAATFAAGDTIYISDKGGDYVNSLSSVANYLVVPSSGSDGSGWPNNNPIMYKAPVGETPTFDASFSIPTTGWSVYSGNIYRISGVAAKVMWEDGVALAYRTAGYEASLTPGQFCYDGGVLYYCPTTGTPTGKTLRGLWLTGNPILFATDNVQYLHYIFDMRDRSNIDVSGIAFKYGGIGHGQKLDPGTTTLVKNNRIYNNSFDCVYWAVWANLINNCVYQDVDIYNNVLSNCNSGISTWVNSVTTVGHTQKPLRHRVFSNMITNLGMIDNSTHWGDAYQDDGRGFADHEGVSFQDPVDCVIDSNEMVSNVTKDYTDDYFATRGIYYWLSNAAFKVSGNQVLRNRLKGRYSPAIYLSVDDGVGYDQTNGGFEYNVYAINVIECTAADTHFQSIHLRGSHNVAAPNPSTNPNYIYNNTINYPNGGAVFEIEGNSTGHFISDNNIIVAPSKVLIDATATADHFAFDYNVYSPDAGSTFVFGDTDNPLNFSPGWQALGFDANGAQVDPVLDPTDSALTSGSPEICKSGGTPIDWVTLTGETQLGIDGLAFSTPPAMGAYAQVSGVSTNYSRYFYATLPGTDADLFTIYSDVEKTAVSTIDFNYVSQSGAAPNYVLHEFKNDATGKNATTLTWRGQTNIACTVSTVVLQIYNRTTGLWEDAPGLNASNNSTGANTDFTLTATVSGLDNYKDLTTGTIACRVYQKAQ